MGNLYGLQFSERQQTMNTVGLCWMAEAVPTDEWRKAWMVDSRRLIHRGYTWKGGQSPVRYWKKVHTEEELEAFRAASRAEDANIDIPRPAGLEFMPFQRAGVARALQLEGCLIADEMGLGKTVQAIAVANVLKARRILVGCPASLKKNWYNEIRKWQVQHLQVYMISPGVHMPMGVRLPDGWWIVSWEIAQRYEQQLKTNADWDLVILDEIHKLKTTTAARTKFFVGGTEVVAGKKKIIPPIRGKRRLALTGTPIPNRPLELYAFLQWLSPKQFSSADAFRNHFCGPSGRGAVNLTKLQMVLRETVMVRRLKSQVLKDLPPKQRQVIALDVNDGDHDSRRAIKEELDAQARWEDGVAEAEYAAHKAQAENNKDAYDKAMAVLKAANNIHFTQMSKVRHNTALAKVPYVIDHLRDLDPHQKYIVFTHHTDVTERIYQAMKPYGAVMMTQRTKVEDRQAIAHQFQDDPTIHWIILTIGVGGVGYTLTASWHVIFAEEDWVPGNISQAEDRAHRISQLNSVLIQHVVFDGSLDITMAQRVISKQSVIKKALDEERKPDEEYEEDDDSDILTGQERRKKWKPDAPIRLTPAQVAAIHKALRIIAGHDADRARQINGVGFNKFDTKFGCELAARDWLTPRQAQVGADIVKRYRRQYSKELYEQIFGESW